MSPSSCGGIPHIRIRDAGEGDLAGVLEIMNQAIEQTPANFNLEPISPASLTERWRMARDTYPWYVAASTGEGDCGVIGFANAYEYKPRAAYRHTAEVAVYVDSDHRGAGVGRALYAALIDELRSRGFHSLIASITLPNQASERLHESFGFRRIGTIRDAGFKFDRWHAISLRQLMLS